MSRIPSRSAPRARGRAMPMPMHAGFRPAAAAMALAAAFACGSAGAQPVGAHVIHGQASLVQTGNNLLVTTQNGPGTQHSAIDWQSFSVPAGSITRFDQPSASSTSINRVTGPDPSAIFGTLRSNGRLVLVNPAGIAVGTGAVVDTAGFTASTLQMSQADAIAGRLRLSNDGNSAGLTVAGTVRAQGGDIVLVAPNLQAAGEALVQSDGATVLAAGHKVEISGRGLEGIHLDVQAGDRAVNLGKLQGDAVGIFAGTLRHSGVVQVQAVSSGGGQVVLQATGGDSLVDGSIEARGLAGRGGRIDVLGQRVGLLAGASLDASGASGGGQVRVGGDYQGQNATVPNAARTTIDADATIRADATQQGDGGRVIVWSDEVTRMHGQVSARGAGPGGKGGFAEVSGRKALEFTGWVDLRAPQGTPGTLLLDPEDVTIVRGAATTPYALPQSTLAPVYGEFGPVEGPTVITDYQLNRQLNAGNVLVTTASTGWGSGGQIKVDPDAAVHWTAATQLGLRADKAIAIDGHIVASDASAALHLQALNGSITEAASGVIAVPALHATAAGSDPGAGSITFTGVNSVGRIAATFSGAQFSFNNSGALAIGTVDTIYGGSTGIAARGDTPGSISVTAGGQLTVESGAAVGDAVSTNGTTAARSAAIAGGAITLAASGVTIAGDSDIAGSGPVTIVTPGALALGGTISSQASGTAVVLSADSLAVPAGGGIVAPAGRWLVYLPRPEGNQFGSLKSDNIPLWNHSFTADPPAAVDQFVGSKAGNRYLFALQPQVDIAIGSTTKVYDGKLVPLPHIAVTGIVDASLYGNAFAQDILTGFPTFSAISKNVGTYAIGRGSMDLGYYAVHFTPGTSTITPRPLTVSLTVKDKVYDGTTAATVSVSGDNRIAGDFLSFATSGSFADKNAGTGKTVKLGVPALGGVDARNYVVVANDAIGHASIAPRTLDVTLSVQDKVYDGSTAATVTVGRDNRIRGDVLDFGSTASFADKNAGFVRPVAVTTQLSGADAGNYVLGFPARTLFANITPAPLTITARDAVKREGDALRFDGSEFSASGLVAGETIASVTLVSAGADAGARANTYAIAPLAAAAGPGFLPANYAISFRDGLLTVTLPPKPSNTQLAGPVDNRVVAFAQAFLQQSTRQQDDNKEIGKDAIVITDTACKP